MKLLYNNVTFIIALLVSMFCMSIFTNVLVAQNENQKQSTNFMQGYVMSQTTQQPIAYATIYNHTTRMGTVSNSEGYFKIKLMITKDSIAVTMLGYRNYHIGLTPNNNFVGNVTR
ncbi:MAG: carboxypeptidase-like regulatory domain-containing protein [Bacteroidetes bacterium]|nr:carboxypeptidase-like regulatory domain-containing protein [Bacteroidota bacterium]